jgi:ATP-dependent protease ClpP protease subunit
MYQDQDPVAPARPVDPVAERLLRARTIVISGEITQKLAADVVSQLVALAPSRIATSPSS